MKNKAIKVLSIVPDNKINSQMIVAETTIGDYLEHAKEMTKNNTYQRKRVKDSHSVYALLNGDLKVGCTFPPLVLACVEDNMPKDINIIINDAFEKNELIILDGLQRTYTMLDVEEELEKKTELRQTFLSGKLILEIYVGINRLGILYRMLTLNTGQTKMSLRHQIEILYESLEGENVEGLEFFRQKDNKRVSTFKQFQYKDAVDCFYAYINRDPTGMDRDDVLEVVSNLEKLSTEKKDHDLFIGLISSFSMFMGKMDNLTNHWTLDQDKESIFGRNILSYFNKSIVMSGYGAALGELKDVGIIKSYEDIIPMIDKISLGCTGNELMDLLSKDISEIKADAKKIGLEQREFFNTLFKYLFVDISDDQSNMKNSLDKAYRRYKIL